MERLKVDIMTQIKNYFESKLGIDQRNVRIIGFSFINTILITITIHIWLSNRNIISTTSLQGTPPYLHAYIWTLQLQNIHKT